ncbi:hypothetical protein Anas_09222 [Armadillidium nasatum]|uniref:Uncharacterized protein n=1 Tax=Armadillidium nasatum TaxID=96803 RepID=A0A5N5SY77_9CRUS|nr:hypothetical protein Anas_09222 [Armadillidium nasatum]
MLEKSLTGKETSVVVIGITLHMRAKYKDKIEGLKVFERYLSIAKEFSFRTVERQMIKHYPHILSEKIRIQEDLPTQSNSIDLYNKIAEKILNGTSVKMWA